MTSDAWTFVFGLAGAAGSIATAAALVFVGWQAFLTRTQVRLRRGWLISRAVEINHEQIVLLCRNYGEVPATVRCVRSKASYTDQPTESDLRATSGNRPEPGIIIFPNEEQEFVAEGVVGINSRKDVRIQFGFVIEYEYLPGNIGEYGKIGELHQNESGATEITRKKEWSKQYGLRSRLRGRFT